MNRRITARNARAESAAASVLAALPPEARAIETGSRRNRCISFEIAGREIYNHRVLSAGYFRPLTSPRLAEMRLAIAEITA